MSDPRRGIPSVDALLASPEFEPILKGFPRQLVVKVTRIVIQEIRNRLLAGDKDIERDGLSYYARTVVIRLEQETMPSLRGVINATGVVLHTNLGRAPLAEVAADAMATTARGYSNLEYDVESGRRGSRYDHCVKLLRELTGAEDAIVVNNNAAALVLVLNTTARGKGVAVSRGELRAEIERLRAQVVTTAKNLENQNFVTKAPEEVVSKEKHKLSSFQERAAKLEEKLDALEVGTS